MAFYGIVAGVAVQICAAGVLAATLAGGRSVGAIAYGPDLHLLAEHIVGRSGTLATLLETLVEFQPDWAANNHDLLVRIQRMNAQATVLLASGTMMVLGTLFFIMEEMLFAA